MYDRLAKIRDFNLLFKYGSFVRGTTVDLKCLSLAKIRDYCPKNITVDKFVSQLRLAISVGTKISKKAVVRNRIKRRVRAAVQAVFAPKAPRKGFYLLLLPKPKTETIVFANLCEEIKLLLSKANVIF